jgi:hypothetical protein
VPQQQEKAIYNDRDMVRKTLRDIKAAGFNVIRMWAFSDGEGQGKLQTHPGEWHMCDTSEWSKG